LPAHTIEIEPMIRRPPAIRGMAHEQQRFELRNREDMVGDKGSNLWCDVGHIRD
jgi:hypothetical protein